MQQDLGTNRSSWRGGLLAAFALVGSLLLIGVSCYLQIQPFLPVPTATPTPPSHTPLPTRTSTGTPTRRPTVTPTPTPTASLTPTTCPSTGAVEPITVGGIDVYFYCGVTGHQIDLVTAYIGHALDAAPPGVIIEGDAFFFVDLDQAVDGTYAWYAAHGWRWDRAEIRDQFARHSGFAIEGAIFIGFQRRSLTDVSDAWKREVILHEMHHLLQYALMGGYRPNPDWIVEGGADYFSRQTLTELDVLMIITPDPTYCRYSLEDLEVVEETDSLGCEYQEGREAVRTLVELFGEDSYYEYFRLAGSGLPTEEVFREAFGIRLAEFYQLFDAYRRSGYEEMPVVPPSATPAE